MKGRECLPYIAELERLLDAEAIDSAYTGEFYEATDQRQEAPSTRQEELRGSQ
jgi:hypothetical protein